MRLCSFASGSSGNCTYVGSDTTHLLVDVGISAKRIECCLNRLDITASDLSGILLTHEHNDHISGLSVFCRRFSIPIYATQGTIDEVRKTDIGEKIDMDMFCPIMADEKFSVGDLIVSPMHVSHDAADPVAYRISYGRSKVAVCTDLGIYNDYTVECLKGLDALILEANHDVNMLEVGPYPYYLKQRILSDRGHLSNENCGRLLCRILHDDLKVVELGHLSKENNLPQLAYETVRMEIAMGDNPYRADDFKILVAERSEMSQIIDI